MKAKVNELEDEAREGFSRHTGKELTGVEESVLVRGGSWRGFKMGTRRI